MEDLSKNNVAELPAPPDESGEAFYVVGGPVQPRRSCYLERAADGQLVDHLVAGHYCHVLAPPQTGKSSLVARSARALRQRDYLTAVVDLSQSVGRGRDAEAGRWYYGIAYRIVRELKIAVDLQHWWQEKKPLPALQRLNEFFWEVVLSGTRSPVVIFFDGLESVKDLDHAEDLFDSVLACQNARASEPEYDRLRFVLLGSVLPQETRNTDLERFRVGRSVELPDFSFEQARPLCRELGLDTGDAERALYRILYWTGGHPYLTQKICRAVARSADPVESDDAVDRLVRERFLIGSAPENEPNLRTTRASIRSESKLVQAALRLYRRVWRGRNIRYDRLSLNHEYLRIAGLIRISKDQTLGVRNRIYGQVFSRRWASQNLPFNWQVAVAGIIAAVLLVGVPYWYVRILPRPYVETLRLATVDYDVAVDAYQGLSRIPGFGRTADELFAGVLERRSVQAATWEEALEADVEMRSVYRQMQRADRLLAEFWDRQARGAEFLEMRDRALIYRIRALESPDTLRLQEAAELIGEDYPYLRSVIRTGAGIDTLSMDPAGDKVVTLTTDHIVQTWDTDTGLAAGTGGGFSALAEEFVTVRRRLVIDADGTVRRPLMRVWIDHPQPSDLWMRLISPSGRAAIIPVRGPQTETGEPFEFGGPDSPLAALAGEQVRGTWILEIEDRFSGSTGLLTAWELRLSGNAEVTEDQPGNPILIPDPRPTSQVRVTLSPDGRRAAAVSANPESRGFLQIWDVSAAALSARVPVEAGDRTLAFDAEGRFLVTSDASPGSEIRIWRADSGQPLMTLESTAGFVLAPALSVSGSMLAVPELPRGNSGLRIRRADLNTAEELAPLVVGGEIVALEVGPQGQFLGTLDRENVVRVLDSKTGQLIAQLAHDRTVARIVFDRSGRWLATVDGAGMARIWALFKPPEDQSGLDAPIVVLEVQDPYALSFSADGTMLLVQPRERSYELLALPAGTPVMPALRHSGEMARSGLQPAVTGTAAVVFDSTGTRVVTGRGGSSARIWNIPAESAAEVGTGFAYDDARVLAINPVGYQVVSGNQAGGISFLDRGQPWSQTVGEDQTAGHAGAITVLSFSNDGSHLLSVGADGSVLLWDAVTRSLAGQRFHHGSGEVSSAAIGPDNRLIATGGELGARLWDGITGEPGPVLGPGRQIIDVAISADGSRVATLSRDTVEFWRADDGELEWSAQLPGRPARLALHGNPQKLAVALNDGRVLVWGQALEEAPAQTDMNGRVLAMRFTPSGRRLLLQTGEWMHLLAVDGARRPIASRLLSGLVPAGAWRAQSPDGGQLAMVTRSGVSELRLVTLDLLKPVVAPASDALAGQEDLWLERLKLRFDTSGVVVPDLRSTRQPVPAGMLPGLPPLIPDGRPVPDQP